MFQHTRYLHFYILLCLSTLIAFSAISPAELDDSDSVIGGLCCKDNTVSQTCTGGSCGTWHACQGSSPYTCPDEDYCEASGCSVVHSNDCVKP